MKHACRIAWAICLTLLFCAGNVAVANNMGGAHGSGPSPGGSQGPGWGSGHGPMSQPGSMPGTSPGAPPDNSSPPPDSDPSATAAPPPPTVAPTPAPPPLTSAPATQPTTFDGGLDSTGNPVILQVTPDGGIQRVQADGTPFPTNVTLLRALIDGVKGLFQSPPAQAGDLGGVPPAIGLQRIPEPEDPKGSPPKPP